MKACAVLAALLASSAALAGDFRSIAENGTIMYDAPSVKAKRLFVATRDYPVEIIVSDGTWMKVRDASGDLVWVERKALAERRTVLVTAPVAEARQAPNAQAAVAFRVQQGVALELSEVGSAGWVRVRLADGRTGFVRVSQVWGL